MAVKLGLRDRAMIALGDYCANATEEDIKRKMQELGAKDIGEGKKSLVEVFKEAEAATAAAATAKPKKKKGRPRIHDTGKQISVWLEADEIRRLRICAAESGESVSEFCAKWIRAGLVHGTKKGGCP